MELDAKEAALLRSILEAVSYEDLPNKLKNLVSEKEYADRVMSTCCDRQLVFNKVAKLAIKNELSYYQTMEKYCRERMRIYPYHLQVTIASPKFSLHFFRVQST
ncbi:Oidioi.mRNA.OKI2018_I69.XSR.g14238.t1.cds [Oikopleura dioica]|uniref:Oidioi.mRNA.OKI2018_I69.XSR.g14238.t1.cds n=1 Tax=Oikopleura dioica TaxID=34765 RepID=A0ABN7SE35_OIKDI|nr:Oidioi.mRNA.OKI2018_I69.XSR.g14238.t1.cds [Oikopleura dioica]